MEVLFKTIHGSRLYGLADNENSDYDWYTVVSENPTNRKRYARQTIVDATDSFVVDLGTWLQMVSSGVPQACEALMSQMPVVDEISELRSSFTLPPSVAPRYLRTMKSFVMQGDFKHMRHGVRLAVNLRGILKTGRFNPTLSEWDRQTVEAAVRMYESEPEELLEFLTRYALKC